jgi:anti-sigma factor RsiW
VSEFSTHPDLLAYLEGRLSPAEQEMVKEHLQKCRSCREEVEQLQTALATLDKVTQRVEAAFLDKESLSQEVESSLGPLADTAEENEIEILTQEDLPQLPQEINRRLAGPAAESVSQRLRRSVEALTDKSKDAVSALVERVMSGGMEPSAAPAIRDDATKVDDEKEPEREEGKPGEEKKEE